MVYGFIQRSNGFIDVSSSLDEGTTFKLYLPRYIGEQQIVDADKNRPGLLPSGTETLLIVDDEVALLELARILLENIGYTVLTATNGKQALQIMHQQANIDLLFSDVVMPGEINGYKLVEQAIREFPDLKVLLTSGFTGKATSNPKLSESKLASNVLSKPYSQNELAARIRALLDEN